jgi:hypothetical protein
VAVPGAHGPPGLPTGQKPAATRSAFTVIVTVVRLSIRSVMLEFGAAPAVNTLKTSGPADIATS